MDMKIEYDKDEEMIDSFSIRSFNNLVVEEEVFLRINYHRIFLISEGKGLLGIDDRIYTIKGKEFFLLAKGQLYTFHPDTIISGYELSFGDCFWEKAPASASNCKAVLFNNVIANQRIPFVNEEELTFLFQTLLEEYHSADYINKPDTMAAYLKIIMIKIANLNASLVEGYNSYEKQLYSNFLDLVSNQYRNTHEVASYAKMLDISTRKLSDICKHCCGTGAKEIINGHLIAEAKRSLQFSSRAVKDIGYDLNFSTPEQFSHFFKRSTGLSPNEFRNSFVEIGR